MKYVKKFLEEANFNTPEVNQRLERLNEVAVILSSLEQDGVVNVSQEWLERTRKLCEGLLFGDWMRLTTTMACHSSFFNGVETIKLPSHMQKKVDEVTKYSKKCQDILESTDKIMRSLIEKVRIHLITVGVIFNNQFYCPRMFYTIGPNSYFSIPFRM